MKKRILACVLLVVMMMGMLPTLALAESVEPPPSEQKIVTIPEDMLRWNGTRLLGVDREWLKSQEKGTLFRLVIPEQTTSISRLYNFNDNIQDYLYSVDFSKAKNLTTLANSAFMYCKNLTEVTGFEDLQLTEIPRQAFFECKKLEQTFDLSKMPLTSIGGSAFNSSGITGVILPDGLKELGPDDVPPAEASGNRPIFSECRNLAFIRTASTKDDASVFLALPNALEVLGPGALKITQNCPLYTSLQEQGATIKLPPSLTKVYHDGISVGKNPNLFILFPDGWKGSDNFSQRAFSSYANYVLVFPDVTTYQEGKTHFANKFYEKSRVVNLTFEGTGQTEKKLYGASVQYVYDVATERWRLDDRYTLPAAPEGTPEPAAGYRGGWVVDGTELTSTSKVQSAVSASSDSMTANYVNDLIAPPTNIRFTINGVPQGSEDVANQNESLVLTVPASAEAPGKLGVALEHPLLKKADTGAGQPYVFFRYLWYDIKQGTMGGDRQGEPGFFHSWLDPANNRAKARDTSEITIAPKDERVYKEVNNPGGTAYNYNHYLVKVFGYYVNENGREQQFYESYCPAVEFGRPLDSLGHTTLDVYGCQVKVGPPVVRYTVTYDLNGGTDNGKYAPVTVEAGGTIRTAEAPTKEGHTFTGWSDGAATHQAGDAIT
ncbi:MAG: leucine-rich repeat protein, partial [Peptococcaceae bacterium]|nr:leucine-rich repeat protein [Peptococcaceae bacterium]